MLDRCIQFINLFKREALRLEDAEVDKEDTAKATGSPNKKHLRSETGWCVIHHVGGCVANRPVEDPVAGDAAGDGLSTEAERKVLALNMISWVSLEMDETTYHHDPSNWTPRDCEEEDVEADKGNEDLVCNFRVGSDADNSDYKLADCHTNRPE